MVRRYSETRSETKDDEKRESVIGRRSYLKLAGGAVVSAGGISGSSNVVQAASDNFGTIGFGEGGYGGV